LGGQLFERHVLRFVAALNSLLVWTDSDCRTAIWSWPDRYRMTQTEDLNSATNRLKPIAHSV
jgi:hypothetical protein